MADGLLALRRILSTQPLVAASLSTPIAAVVRECLGEPAGRPTAASFADRLSTLV
ncbi:MAG: hypothetical protein L0Y54_09205 [Sporichthyaceae bacterium]|nr:hypothetical protein [Sporichthyaceae bacterium]